MPRHRIRPVRRPAILALAALVAGCTAERPQATDPDYRAEIEQQRAERERRLSSEDGWLTLVALHWLEPGEQAFGSDPSNALVLPQGTPARAGTLRYDGTAVRLIPEPGVALSVAGEPVTAERALADDGDGAPDLVAVGRVTLQLLRRGDRRAVRVKDPEAATRTGFAGIDYFPVDAAWRVNARLVPYETPREVEVPAVIGPPAKMQAPGALEFTLDGARHTLVPFASGDEGRELFIIFRDRTSGQETYGAGRYLYATLEENGEAVLDFNRAYNPPCAFTPYATCPLPPRENRLDLAVAAGEKVYGPPH